MEAGSRHLLVVDDDASIRLLCRVNLELEGWTVHEAASLDEARAALANGEIQIVLLDIHIGSENGAELLEEIRRSHPRIPVAMLTGSVGTPTLDDVRPDGVIPKPFTLEELVGTVRDLTRVES